MSNEREVRAQQVERVVLLLRDRGFHHAAEIVEQALADGEPFLGLGEYPQPVELAPQRDIYAARGRPAKRRGDGPW